MDFPFYEQFKELPTVELLKIVNRPEDHQASAVEAAARVLQEREVSPSDVAAVENYFTRLEEENNARIARTNAYKEKATDLLQPVLQPTATLIPEKWFGSFLLVYGGYYIWGLYQFIKTQVLFLRCKDCPVMPGAIFWTFFDISYSTITFYLLLKQKRLGWILLFAWSIIFVVSRIAQLNIYYKYKMFGRNEPTYFLVPVLINTAFVFFLWRKEIAGLFGVNEKTKKITAWVAIGIAVLTGVWLQVVFL